MDARTYFRFVATLTVGINLAVGISAIFLVERLAPAIDEILKENAASVSSSVTMHEAMLLGQESDFWIAFQQTQENITITGEKDIVANIEKLAKVYWANPPAQQRELTLQITELSNINMQSMKDTEDDARFLSLSGGWALGFLVIFSTGLQLVVRSKILASHIEPISEMVAVIRDYSDGNSLRRFRNSNAASEIQAGGDLLNRILDQDMAKHS